MHCVLPILTIESTGVNFMKSKTDQAIDYMKEHNVSGYAAAQHFGITAKAVNTKLRKLAAETRCPCCGQVVKDPSNLKEKP